MADPAISNRIVEKVRNAEPREVLPEHCVEPVHQVKINMIGVQPDQLLIEVLIHVTTRCNQPAGKLRGEVNFFTIPAGECPADKGFTLTIMIRICRINIIHPVIDGIPEHLRCMVLIDLPIFLHGESHAPEPEDGEFRRCFEHFPVEHVFSTLSLILNEYVMLKTFFPMVWRARIGIRQLSVLSKTPGLSLIHISEPTRRTPI